MPSRPGPLPASSPNTPSARMSVASAAARPDEGKRLIFLVTEDWYFWAHRLPLARAARDAGYDVTIATRVDLLGERIAAEGFRLAPLSWKRGSINPFGLLSDVLAIVRLY